MEKELMPQDRTFARINENTLKLQDYISLRGDGEIVPYKQIQADTGILMDLKGKSNLRSALKRLKMEYTCIAGLGIELASKDNAVGILTHKFVKVSNAMKGAKRTQRNIQNQFYNQLDDVDKKKVVLAGALFAAMESMSDLNAPKLTRKVISNTENYSIEIPNI